MKPFGVNVRDLGAAGDGVTDDAAAIQAAIDKVYDRGGGTVFFPFTPHGYRIARPAPEEVGGKPCRSQLHIPSEPSDPLRWRNLCLEGEMPVRQLYAYQGRTGGGRWPATEFPMAINNCVLFSDWEAPANTERPNERPWSLLSVLGGSNLPFGLENLTLRNLELRVVLDSERMYPTSTAANLKDTSRLIVEHCHFGLTRNVCSLSERKELQANPCFCAGLIASADQNDHQAFRSVGVQGFKYGFVFGEHTVADYLYVHNCEEAIVFHDSSHLSHLHHVVAQHNRVVLSALRQDTFGLPASRDIHVVVDSIDLEPGAGSPAAYRLLYGVYDPDDRMDARVLYHVPRWARQAQDEDAFPVCGGRHVRVESFASTVTARGASD